MTFTLDGDSQVYELRFDFNALADAEPEVQCNLLEAVASWPNLSCRQMRALLYGLLKPAHPLVLVAEAGTLLTRDMGTVSAAIKQALVEAALLVSAEEVKQEPVAS